MMESVDSLLDRRSLLEGFDGCADAPGVCLESELDGSSKVSLPACPRRAHGDVAGADNGEVSSFSLSPSLHVGCQRSPVSR